MRIETAKECYLKRGYYPDENGKVMLRYRDFNYHVCKNLESAIQFVKDMFPISAHEMFTLVYWN